MRDMKSIIKRNINDEITKTLGNVDLELFDYNDYGILYYLFPLIEKTTIEILKLYDDSNVEWYTQGTYRTLNSIMDDVENRKRFRTDVIESLKIFYSEKGLRNRIMHYSKEYDKLEITINCLDNIKFLFCKLIQEYERSLSTIENGVTRDIEYL